jgi:branched-chain amino acid transport system permease protein
MRQLFRTAHEQDLHLFADGRERAWYAAGLAMLVVAPFLLPAFYVNELAYVFVLAIASVGMMILTGFAGLVSLGHGALMGIGAYAHVWLVARGVPFLASIALAAAIAAAIGALASLPLRRLAGIYLAVATFAMAVISIEVFEAWDEVTGGLAGLRVPPPEILGYVFQRGMPLYFLCLAFLLATLLVARNLMRSRSGRAMLAVRDSEVAAGMLGISTGKVKAAAFAISAAFAAISGALLGHTLGYISPEAFDFVISLQLLLMIVVGGLGSLRGAVAGAVLVGYLPQAIATLKAYLPYSIADAPALEAGLFGLILTLVILYEPAGLVGRWDKIKLYFQTMPTYRADTFRRRRVYARTGHLR